MYAELLRNLIRKIIHKQLWFLPFYYLVLVFEFFKIDGNGFCLRWISDTPERRFSKRACQAPFVY